MSDKNFWGDEDSVSEYEQLEEEIVETEQRAQEIEDGAPLAYAEEEQLEEIIEESAFELDEEEANIIYNARLRLEMARLYEMLINHNLFEGVDASPQAIKQVQNEVKDYIVERLEILLGIKEEKIRQTESEFGEDEAEFLKQLAHKGMSMSGRPATIKPSELKPLSRPASSNKLKTLANSKPTSKTRKKVLKRKAMEAPLPTKPTRKIRKKKTSENSAQSLIKSHGFPRKLTDEEAEVLAREDMRKTKGKKPFHKMSAKEKASEVSRVNSTHARKADPSSGRSPPMSMEQQQMMYTNQQNRRAGNSPNQLSTFNNILAAQIASKKLNEGD